MPEHEDDAVRGVPASFVPRPMPLGRPVPLEPPVYRSSPPQRRPWRTGHVYALLDAVFVGIATVMAVWFAVLCLREGFSLAPVRLLYLLGFWLLLTYVALPRFHQLLTSFYLPDYFFGRTRSQDGVLSDPINIALEGSEADIHTAMRRAGWVLAEERTVGSAWRMVVATLTRRSYEEAPVSDLLLMGRRHLFCYQQEVGGTTAQRHHVRFWRMPDDFVLPGGQRATWLAAGTYDRGVGLSWFTGQFTHRIDEDIDAERDYLIDTLRFADPEIDVAVIREFSTSYHHRNSQGDSLRTDGDLPIIDVTGARARSHGATALMLPRNRPTGLSVVGGRRADRGGPPGSVQQMIEDVQSAMGHASEHHLPPPTVILAAVLLIVPMAILMIVEAARLVGVDLSPLIDSALVVVPSPGQAWQSLVVGLIGVVLLAQVLRRGKWARLGLMVLFAVDSAARLVVATALVHAEGEHGALTAAGLSVLGIMAITSQASRMWVMTERTSTSVDES